MRTAASTCALARPRSRTWWAVGLALVAGCTASADEVHPPENELFFPTGLAVAPADQALFVANSNSELRYDSGSISVIDLGAVYAAIDAWIPDPMSPTTGDPGGCEPDPEHAETLVCDEARFFRRGASVRIGNFATDIAIQDFSASGSTNVRVFVPTRGDPSVAWADFDGDKLRCSTGTEGFALCDDAHRLSSLYNDPDLAAIENEPFGVFADGPGGFAVVSHLTGGAVTLIKAPADSSRVQIVDVNRNLFAPDAATLISSATGIVGRPRGPGQAPTDPSLIYVGSRSDRRVQTMTVGQLPVPDQPTATEPAYLLQGSYFFLAQVGSNFGNSTDTRGMRFSPSGDRLYLVNRQPASLQLFDTSLDEGGFPRNRGVGAMDICRQGSTVAVFDPEDSDPTTSAGERAYVTCFQDGELYVVDPRDLSQPEDILLVGRGPYSVVAARTRKLLFVSNTLEDTIAVVDVDPAHLLTHNRVVLRIGTPRIQ